LDRRGSSCPILFSWNGHEYEFIADMIGPGVVGHWIAPGERDVPDPDEYLKVSAQSVKPREGMLSFRFLEPMQETVYLDQVHWLELDLGAWDAQKPLRLIIDGYTDYFTATSMYAADQAGIKVIAPYVEAQDAQGQWVRIAEDMGFPAGLERTMIADLTGKLPP